jgi:hypothetical protein
MKEERNKRLTEKLGYEYYMGLDCYVNKDVPYLEYCVSNKGIDFSTWRGFGKLWVWVQENCYNEFFTEYCQTDYAIFLCFLETPDKFADAVYEFLSNEETK